MPEPKQISPLLDNILIGDAISEHNGIRCYPAMHTETNNKYILKIISVPSSPTKLDALLLTGALENEDAAKTYFQQCANELVEEIELLQNLSRQEGFLPIAGYQVAPMEDSVGFNIYILSPYRQTLERRIAKHPLSQLDALNLGLDLCSALTACRRSGYLFVNLKPSNIFLNDNGEYRISDLGFLPLNALKYATISEHYIGCFTPPEITDPFAALNETLDVYATGMILYSIYNGGVLPENTSVPFPAPAYADEELSAIIMKACCLNEQERYPDPAQMGQMLVAYMQKNGAFDIPIIPPIPEPEPEPIIEPEIPEFCDNSNYENISIDEMIDIIDAIEIKDCSNNVESTVVETENSEAYSDSTISNEGQVEESEQVCENDVPQSECMENPPCEVSPEYDDISEEVSAILSQADVLAEMDVPEPAVAPDVIEVILPDESEEPEVQTEILSPADDTEEDITMKNDDYLHNGYFIDEEPKQSSHRIRNTVIILLLLSLLVGGILFYTLYVAKTVEQLQVTGNGDDLTVTVLSDADESLLSVSCLNTETQVVITVPVSNGKAEFTGLSASTKYEITVQISGLHILNGSTQYEYATPAETTIVQYDVEIGEIPGTVKITFAVNGPDSEHWNFTYSAEGQQSVTEPVTGHSFTLKGLKENQKYTGILEPGKNLMIKDPLEISFTASELIRAKDLKIVSCFNGSLTAQWNAPESIAVESWFARCYNENYDQTINIKNTTATFQGLNSSEGFTVEVWAQGQSAKQTQIVDANSVTVENFSAELTSPGTIDLEWQSAAAPQGGWVISYRINESETVFQHKTTNTSAVIAPVAPGCKYVFAVSAADESIATFCQEQTCMVPAAGDEFSITINDKDITQKDLQVSLCKRPSSGSWSNTDAIETQTFSAGDKLGLLLFLKTKFEKAEQELDITVVIHDETGNLVDIFASTVLWNDIWTQNYYTLNLPAVPDEAGCYDITLYLNNMTVFEADFSVS